MAVVASEAQLCNLALLAVGERQIIDSLDEPSQQARLCKAIYGPARDVLLEAAWWRFASRRVTLAEAALTTRDEWAYCYLSPADLVDPQYIFNGVPPESDSDPEPYSMEANDAGDALIICCNRRDAVLAYTARIITPGLFPAFFVKALVASVAAQLAAALPVKPDLALALEGRAEKALLTAIAHELNQQRRSPEPESQTIRVR